MNILFVCDTNTIKGPIAEALAHTYFLPDIKVLSAGLTPGPSIHPRAIFTLKELDIDVKNTSTRGFADLPEEFARNIDHVIILNIEDIEIPTSIKAKNRTKWFILDPSKGLESQLHEEFQMIRDEIADRIKDLSETL